MTTYSSKILLFGEHIVNMGADALAIPYPSFYAKLSFDKLHSDYVEESNHILSSILAYISAQESLASRYDLSRFETDLEKGLGFHMNIPIGYGLGSSGALVAAVYNRFALKKDLNEDELKQVLGETESFFHGKSSGLDPLVSYLNQSVRVAEKTELIPYPLLWKDKFEIFLLNTHKARKTGPLVEAFLARAASDSLFSAMLHSTMIPLNNLLVANFIHHRHEHTMELVEELSKLQLTHLKELILPEHMDLFMLGLASKDYFLKICGAGGGGFMLGFTKSKETKLPFEVVWL